MSDWMTYPLVDLSDEEIAILRDPKPRMFYGRPVTMPFSEVRASEAAHVKEPPAEPTEPAVSPLASVQPPSAQPPRVVSGPPDNGASRVSMR